MSRPIAHKLCEGIVDGVSLTKKLLITYYLMVILAYIQSLFALA